MAIQNPKGPHHVEHETGGVDALATLDGSIILTGTIPDARHSANIPRLNVTNTFTKSVTISDAAAALALIDTGAPTNQRLFLIQDTGQSFRISAFDDAFGSQVLGFQLSRAGDVNVGRDLYEKGRGVPMGHWSDVPFSAANFTAAGGGSWTVGSAAVLRNRYALVGKTILWSIYISWFSGSNTVAGTVTTLFISTPSGIVIPSGGNAGVLVLAVDSGTQGVGLCQSNGSVIQITRLTGGNWSAGAPGIQATLAFEIN